MKPSIDIFSDFSFYILLGFLLLIPFSIAACYLLFTLLAIQLILFSIKAYKAKQQPDNPDYEDFQFPAMPGYYRYFLFYVLATLVSTVFSIAPLHSFKDNKEVFIYLLIPIFLLVINSKKRLEQALAAVLISAVASSLLGIIQTLLNGISLNHRLKGATSHWMTFSGLLMFSFIFFFVLLFFEKQKKRKIIIAVCLVPILASIFLSLTRSVWVGAALAVGLFIIYYKPKILYFAVPLALILAVALPSSVKSRVTSIFDMKNETNRDRLYMAQIAFSIFKDYPLTGVGPNNIEKVYDRYRPSGATLTNMHLHNNFLHVLAERGLISLLILLAAFGSVLILLFRKMKNTLSPSEPPGILNEKIIATAALFTFIGFIAAGMFEYNFGDSEVRFLLFFFLSIPFLPVFEENQTPLESRSGGE